MTEIVLECPNRPELDDDADDFERQFCRGLLDLLSDCIVLTVAEAGIATSAPDA